MWNFQRIICIWICCVSCMFGTTQLSTLVQAVPYEYFDDHEQSFYDLDTEQIQAKYDTRLLSQQMLQTEQQQQQQQQQQQHLENLKGYHNTNSGSLGLANRNKLETRKHIDAGISKTTKLKSNEGYNTLNVLAADDDDDTNNTNDDDEHNHWLKETATKAATADEEATSAITETFDELHLPRAASCFTNGQKYTHGQKVPRLDNCEVCLCMDGEIFCWWEKCDKKSTKASTTYEDYSTPFEESSTTRIQLNPKTTYKTTLKPMKKPKTNEDYKYDDDDSAEIFEMQQEYEGLKEQLMRKEHEQDELQQQQQQYKLHNHNKQMVKKKIYQQQEEEKHNKKIKEQNKKKQEEQQRHKQQQQQKQKQHKNNEQHHHAHNRNKNNNSHDYSSSGSNSKILNFPENLPSVLYYDYKTEEHHQHQHQHHEQHLKHQRQKQQQHEKELKHRQQQQEQQEQEKKQKHHINRHHEYGQDFNTYSSSSNSNSGINNAALNKDEGKFHDGFGGPSTTFKYFSNGNENIYNGDLQTDSDILPEPPTKKPKYSTSITETTATQAKTTGIPISQLYHFSTSLIPAGDGRTVASTTVEAITKSTATTTTNTPLSMPTITLKKENFSPWDYNNVNRDKINNSNNNNNKSNNKQESTEDDIIDTDDQDDAFHRWLTSTEKNNKNNFTLNDSIIERDGDDGFGTATIAGDGGGGGIGGFDVSNSDYNMDDRNYENFNLAKEATKTNADIKPLIGMGVPPGTTTTTINAFDDTLGVGVQGIYADGNSKIMYENSQKPKYEQNFNDNNSYNTNNNNNNYNNPYHNNNMEQPTSRSSSNSDHIISSTTSNEDNGVASVVNIDIMLTASSADSQQQQQQPQQTNIIETTNQLRQQQQQLKTQQRQHQQDFEHEKQIAKEQIKFIQTPPVLISNTNDVDNNNKNPLYSIINDNTKSYYTTLTSNNNNKTINHIVGDGLNIELQNMGVNLSSSNNSNNNTTSQNLSNSNNDSFRFKHISTLVSQTNATSATTIAGVPAATTPPLSTTLSPERQCNVMGTLYKIGDILPQDTGNCLQCICIDGSTSDDTPRVTCSPHNCPPLVLPDLFDATGY